VDLELLSSVARVDEWFFRNHSATFPPPRLTWAVQNGLELELDRAAAEAEASTVADYWMRYRSYLASIGHRNGRW